MQGPNPPSDYSGACGHLAVLEHVPTQVTQSFKELLRPSCIKRAMCFETVSCTGSKEETSHVESISSALALFFLHFLAISKGLCGETSRSISVRVQCAHWQPHLLRAQLKQLVGIQLRKHFLVLHPVVAVIENCPQPPAGRSLKSGKGFYRSSPKCRGLPQALPFVWMGTLVLRQHPVTGDVEFQDLPCQAFNFFRPSSSNVAILGRFS